MSKTNVLIIAFVLIVAALGCKSVKSLLPGKTTSTSAPTVDLDSPAKPVDVTVELDKKQTVSGKVTNSGGTVSLTAADGSKFTLDVPANAVDADTTVTMTAVKNMDGAPLDNTSPTAIQLEPSGLFFKEMATLTIIPGKEIPINQQIAFGYEGDGKDYRLALVDPKSKDLQIKLLRFSGAGVGSGSEAAWAQNLMIQAREAGDRIGNRLAQYTQEVRMQMWTQGEDSVDWDEVNERFKSYFDQLEDQVVRKEEAAADLDCKHAKRAVEDIIQVERQRQILGLASTSNFEGRVNKLRKTGEGCRKSYRVNSSSEGVSLTGEICSLDKPFSIDEKFPGGSGKVQFNPASATGGSQTESGAGSGCTQTASGDYSVSLNEDGSGTITWNMTATVSCIGFSNTRTHSFSVPLQPAPDLSCP